MRIGRKNEKKYLCLNIRAKVEAATDPSLKVFSSDQIPFVQLNSIRTNNTVSYIKGCAVPFVIIIDLGR